MVRIYMKAICYWLLGETMMFLYCTSGASIVGSNQAAYAFIGGSVMYTTVLIVEVCKIRKATKNASNKL